MNLAQSASTHLGLVGVEQNKKFSEFSDVKNLSSKVFKYQQAL